MSATRLRVIADVHGHPDMLAAAIEGAEQIVLLGDLVDRGPDSPATLRLALNLIEAGRARLVRSNHDDKLYRALCGRGVRIGAALGATLAALDAAQDAKDLIARFRRTYEAAPLVIAHGFYRFAHGAVVEDAASAERASHMALYGETNGKTDGRGKPIRLYKWVDRLAHGVTAVVGHDVRDRSWPHIHVGAGGGRAIFLDTGCGFGGPLSYFDLPDERFGQVLPA